MKVSFLVLASLLLPVLPAQGQDLVWARQMGGQGINRGSSIARDDSGNLYTVGYFQGAGDFDPGPGAFSLTGPGLFVSKLDSAGNFVWAKHFGGSQASAEGVALDGSGNVYTTGRFKGTADFDPGPGVFRLTSAGNDDIFLCKLDNAGNFVWAKRMGGIALVGGLRLALDGGGNVYTTGNFQGAADFDPGPAVFTLTSAGGDDIYVSKLDSAGNFVWAKQMGGITSDQSWGVALDGGGNVYTTGYFRFTADFDPGPDVFNLTAAGATPNIFVSKLDSAGNFVWARRMGGTGPDFGWGLALDGGGNVYTTGGFEGTGDFDPGPGVFNLTAAGGNDIFVSKLDNDGNFVWAKQMGGPASSRGRGVALDGAGNVYMTGAFSGAVDFDPGPGVFTLTAAGRDDIFVSKLDDAGNFVWAAGMGGMWVDEAVSVALDGSGNVYTTGSFQGIADFDPGPGVVNLAVPADAYGTFVVKLKDVASAGQLPAISKGGIVLATLLPAVATVSPLAIISVFGENFSTEIIANPNLDSEGKLDTILGGTCLLKDGEAQPMFAVFPNQINAQVSADKTFGPASFTVVTNCATAAPLSSAPLTIEISGLASPAPRAQTSGVEIATVEEATPGFFLFPPLAAGGLIAARFNADAVAVAPEGKFTDQYGTSRPARPGEIIVLYGTGWGETTAALGTGELAAGAAELLPEANPTVTFGGIPMAPEDVLYVGVTPNTAGLYQLAIRVPAIALPGDNQVLLTVYGNSTPAGPVIPVAAP